MDLGLAGRVAIVTGASQGIGREIALGLAREGASLVLCARRPEPLAQVAKECEAVGPVGADVRAEVVAADVTDPATPARLVAAAVDGFGRLDVLVNNAGKGGPKRLLDLTDEDWRASFELNFFSAARLAVACVPAMRSRGWGRIVNVSTRVAREPDAYFAPYGAAKAALVNFSKSLANAFSKDGVLTNCVVPGLVHSEAVDEAAAASAAATGKSVDEVFAAVLAKRPIPAGRMGEPAEVAALVVFLASEQASWITGASFTIDGGIVRSAF